MTYINKVKCLKCSLHFATFTWKDNWRPAYCPECGKLGETIMWKDETTEEIFEIIPGYSPLVEAWGTSMEKLEDADDYDRRVGR